MRLLPAAAVSGAVLAVFGDKRVHSTRLVCFVFPPCVRLCSGSTLPGMSAGGCNKPAAPQNVCLQLSPTGGTKVASFGRAAPILQYVQAPCTYRHGQPHIHTCI